MSHVVIVGAGPAGATLSYLLARRGIGVTLLERHTDFAREFRGEALMPSGVDAFAQMGLSAVLDSLPQTQLQSIEIYRAARKLLRIDIARTFGLAGPRIISQPALLETLVAAAGRFPGFRLVRGATVRDLIRNGERITGVHFESSHGGDDAHGDFVIGTDGRASLLRQRAGLHETHTPQTFDIVWAKIPLPPFLADRSTGRAYLGRGHFMLMFPSYDGRLQIGWVIDKGTFGDLRHRGVNAWLMEMCGHVSPDLSAHLRASQDAITQPFLLDVLSDRLTRWTAPGLLLLGDAAHPMSPVGAQGINIALRDALVAANQLCPVLTQGGDAAQLDAAARRVQQERLPEVSAIQTLQQAPPRLLFGQAKGSGVVLGLLPLIVRTGLARRLLGFAFRRFASGMASVRLEV